MSVAANAGESQHSPLPCKAKNQSHLVANDPRKSNRILSRIIPPVLVAIAIFSCYVWYDMCFDWYLKNGRTSTAICLITFHIVILILMSGSFFRIIFTPAGYLPTRHERDVFLSHGDGISLESRPDGPETRTFGRAPSQKEIKAFLEARPLSSSVIYLARSDPSDQVRYCSTCDMDKYDRVHHCSEVNRCIKKFDHFCPWVGGPLRHSRYKFFFQFITYVAIYCLLVAITLGVAVSQRNRAQQNMSNAMHIPDNPGLWYAVIAIASLFALLMVPFSAFHAQQIASNKTTIESVDTRAVQVVVTTNFSTTHDSLMNVRQRVTLAAGVNPFDLGSFKNIQQVLGLIYWDKWLPLRILNWFVPIQASPGDGLHFQYSEELLNEVRRQASEIVKGYN